MSERATTSGVPPLRQVTQVALIGSAVVGAALFGYGGFAAITAEQNLLLAVTLGVIGVLGMALAAAAFSYRARPAWAVLVAMWGVLAFCAFFAAPKLVGMRKLEAVTVEMELTKGRKKAEQEVEDKNLIIRLENLAVCTLFALPFGLLCAGLAIGGRDFEPVATRRS